MRTPTASGPSATLPLVVFSHLRWDFVYQRPQHLLSRLAADRPVLFIEEPVPTEGADHWTFTTPAPGVEVARPHTNAPGHGFGGAQAEALAPLVDTLRDERGLAGAEVWLYTPLALALARRLAPSLLIVDAMDELALFAHAAPELVEAEAEALALADVVFTGGQSLYERRKGRHAHVFCFPSSVDAAHFASALDPETPEPEVQAALPEGPRLGFFGVVDERMNPALLAAVADADPSWQVVVVGPTVKIDPATLPRRPNLHYVGQQPYEALPAFLRGWDVCLMPWTINEATRFLSPTKTLEYFAAERPVVSTPLADVAGPYGHIVALADTPEAFVAACRAALAETPEAREARIAAQREVLAHTSWDATAAAMAREIDAARARRAARAGDAALSSNAAEPDAAAGTDGAANVAARADDTARTNSTATADSKSTDPATAAESSAHEAASATPPFSADGAPAGSSAAERGAPAGGDGHAGTTPTVEAVLTTNGHGEAHKSVGTAERRVASAPYYDYLVVGAGFAGAVLAERLAAGSGKRVLVVDRRRHIGGNAYDTYNREGLLVHPYGPHIFHTNSARVFDYLSRFTAWRPYEHRVRASVDGQHLPIPINLDTVNGLYGLSLTAFELDDFFARVAEPVSPMRTSEDVVVGKVGRDLYNKFFRGYTRKQWDLDPSELDASVTARVPVRTNRDDRYFADTYQAMPRDGYTRMFEAILNHPRISLMLQTDYREVAAAIPHGELIFTGPVDEYFDRCYGALPYRSLRFDHQTLPQERFQPVGTINYPNEHAYTRITEFKHLTGQRHPHTAIVTEYPAAEGDPYYPIPRPENAELYRRYAALAAATPGVHFVGRLATYKYYNMDQVVAQALALYERIAAPHAAAAPVPSRTLV